MTTQYFRRIPVAMLNRMRNHIIKAYQAGTTAEQESALFLLHCEMKDADELIHTPVSTRQPAAVAPEGEEV